MSDANKAAVRRWYEEGFNKGNVDDLSDCPASIILSTRRQLEFLEINASASPGQGYEVAPCGGALAEGADP